MFECRSCVLRSLRAIAGDGANAQTVLRPQHRLLLTPRLEQSPIRRLASTRAATRDDDLDDFVQGAQPIPDERDDGDRGTGRNIIIRDEKALQKELTFLRDPLKLAEHVRYTLRNNNPSKALDLCRLASKHGEVTVSWNHCVDWHLNNGKVDEAMKIYNEMKKRGQFPDSYTYVILMRGLARPHHHGGVVKQANVVKAVAVYNSMSNPNSRVKPTVFHTNAALRVCSAALDMDALWTIASKLPSKGPGAADHITYAILLTAIRHGAMGNNPEGPTLDQIALRRQDAVNQGRRIWQEVIAKWRGGEIHIDEELVCAMGRLLLISKRMQDWDDVLHLVQQTMMLDRQVAPLGSPGRKIEHVPIEDKGVLASEDEPAEDAEGYKDAPSTKAFYPVTPLPRDSAQPKRPTSLAYVQPSNPTLSMLISACTTLRIPKAADAYWAAITSADEGAYNINPDLPNYHSYLRLLAVNRASGKAAGVLQGMSKSGAVAPKNQTFRIAMSVCMRDKNNPNALRNAREMVDEMEKCCADPDVHTLTQYLNLALLSDDRVKIVSALDRMDPMVHNLRSRVTYGADEPKHDQQGDQMDKRETVELIQVMVGVIDTLLNRGMVAREEYSHWHGRRSMLTKFISTTKARWERNQTSQMSFRPSAKTSDETELDEGGGEESFGRATRRPKRVGREQREMPGMSRAMWELKKEAWRERRKERTDVGRVKAQRLRGWEFGRERLAQDAFGDSPLDLASKWVVTLPARS